MTTYEETRRGVLAERCEHPSGETWIDFSIGPSTPSWLRLGATLNLDHTVEGGPVDLVINGNQVDGPWTLETLRRLHSDLGKLLTDVRLPGALSEAWGFYTARDA